MKNALRISDIILSSLLRNSSLSSSTRLSAPSTTANVSGEFSLVFLHIRHGNEMAKKIFLSSYSVTQVQSEIDKNRPSNKQKDRKKRG